LPPTPGRDAVYATASASIDVDQAEAQRKQRGPRSVGEFELAQDEFGVRP